VTRRRQVLIAVGVVFAVVIAVAPLRRLTNNAASRVLLFALSPLAPSISGFRALPQGSQIVATDGTVLAQLDGTQKRESVKLHDVPLPVRRSILAAEDANFYGHGGVDLVAIARAAYSNVRGDRVQGGSTITQQLAKINYTNRQRTFFRKFREVLYAGKLEQHYSKDQLLERYINQVYFGDGAYGIAAASHEFFGVEPSQLTVAQAATLAGKIRAPQALDPRSQPEKTKVRRDQVLRSMSKHGWLSKTDLQSALSAPLDPVPPPPSVANLAPHFVEYVKREAQSIDVLGATPDDRNSQLYNGGYTVETTLDPKAFAAAQAAVQAELNRPNDPATGVASVVPGDGAIRALYDSQPFDSHQFDVASQGHRQPGSSFKPFVYLAALQKGISPQNQFDAKSPVKLSYKGESYTVDNAEPGINGPMTVDDAMVASVNAVYAQLVLQVGPDVVSTVAKSDGFSEDLGQRPSIALGGLHNGVNPLEMASAYATFAAKGVYAQPYSIVRIRDRQHNVVWTHEAKTRNVYDAKQVGVLNSILEQVVQRGTGTAAAIGRPVAGKTGTTDEFKDAWFAGYVPQLATAVWVGVEAKPTPMKSVHGRTVFGGTFPAEIFSRMMKQTLDGVPPEDLFTAPEESLGLTPSTTTTASTAPILLPTSTLTTPPEPTSVPTDSTTTSPDSSTTSSTDATTTTRKSTTTTTRKK
jgi:membrane peptidoglycan carboxypeptidase